MPISHRLTPEQKAEIRAADPSVSDSELAAKYGVVSNTIWYHRSGPGAKKAAKGTLTKADLDRLTERTFGFRTKPEGRTAEKSAKPSAERAAQETTPCISPLAFVLATLTEEQCDAAFSILPLQTKQSALRAALLRDEAR